jgi:hypothetical protein
LSLIESDLALLRQRSEQQVVEIFDDLDLPWREWEGAVADEGIDVGPLYRRRPEAAALAAADASERAPEIGECLRKWRDRKLLLQLPLPLFGARSLQQAFEDRPIGDADLVDRGELEFALGKV